MKTSIHLFKQVFTTAVASVLMVACSTTVTKPNGAEMARNKLTELQADPQLASRAPVAVKDAELAVRAAEQQQKDPDLNQHLVFMADRKVDIAWAQAQNRLFEEQRKTLAEERQTARLDSRTREADIAHIDAETARMDADDARTETAIAVNETAVAQQETDDLQRQIAELNAKKTERGLVVTLGDVLFQTGKSDIQSSAASHLGKLATFLTKYGERTVIIEGHTDNVGSDDANIGLSQRRADAVKSWLVRQGVGSSRLATSGKGESSPIASNDSSTGRQENRRVEVIIANTAISSR